MTEDEKNEYIREHPTYELLMARYTYGMMSVPQHQLLWNALFEAFSVHVRALYAFLKNEKDQRNAEARDFNDKFKVKDAQSVRGALDKLNRQVLHLGKLRTSNMSEKVDLSQAARILNWIEARVSDFVAELSEKYKEHWLPDRADPAKDDSMMTKGPTGPAAPPVPTATNHVTMVKTEVR